MYPIKSHLYLCQSAVLTGSGHSPGQFAPIISPWKFPDKPLGQSPTKKISLDKPCRHYLRKYPHTLPDIPSRQFNPDASRASQAAFL